MTTLDFIILGIILAATIVGAYKGFVSQAGTIAGVVLAVLGCRFFGGTIADRFVTAGAEHETVYRALIYTLLFIAIYLGVRFVASLFGKALSALHVRVVDRLGGAIFCAAAWMLAMSVALNVYLLRVCNSCVLIFPGGKIGVLIIYISVGSARCRSTSTGNARASV